MAKKTEPQAPAPESADLLESTEATAEAESSAAASIDVYGSGRTWLDKQVGIDQSEADFHANMRAVKVTTSKPININGRRFFPGLKGKVKEVRDF